MKAYNKLINDFDKKNLKKKCKWMTAVHTELGKMGKTLMNSWMAYKSAKYWVKVTVKQCTKLVSVITNFTILLL